MNAPRAVERHHLFPKAFLAKSGVTNTRQTNAIANMAFLDWAENARISDQAPIVYWPMMTEGIPDERLRRQRYLHALPIGWEQLDYPTFLEKRRSLMAQVVRDGFTSISGESQPKEITTSELIASGEGHTVEFKSTARWNLHTAQADPKLEHLILKTVCGFLNAEGGSLFIGVDDEGNILGIDKDLATLGHKANMDGYELFLRQLLETGLSVPTAATVRIGFEAIGGHELCVVRASASGKPVFAKPVKGQGGADASEFWVRIGNQTASCTATTWCSTSQNTGAECDFMSAFAAGQGDCRQEKRELMAKDGGSWTVTAMYDMLGEFEAELRAAGLEEATIRTYVDRSTYFIRWLDDDYHPRGPNR